MATSRPPGWTLVTSRPPIWMVPEVGASSPAMVRSRVVLPQPDGPSRAKNSPSSMRRSRRSIARTPPGNSLTSELSTTSAISA
jgi:hypothetical protein